ncbi:MAG: hypothetical protein ABI216_22000 [Devosia sp.]
MKISDSNIIAYAARSLTEQCHGAAKASGWWKNNNDEDIRDNPLTFSNKLMLTVSEISEAMEADRKDQMDDKLPHRHGREVEIADAIIRLFDLAGGYGLDVAGAIAEKLEFNSKRADHKMENRKAPGGKAY